MPEPVNESQLTKRIVTEVQRRLPDVWLLKVHGDGYQRKGVPDLLFSLRGRMVAIEVKHRKPGESVEHLLTRVSRKQHDEIRKLQNSGAIAEVCWSVEQVMEILDGIDSDYFDL